MTRRRDPRARRTSPSASSSTASTPSAAEEQIQRCATVHGNLVVLDLRDEEVIHPTNRFMIYALFPQCNISIHVMWGLKQQNTVFATGKSILDRARRRRRRADARATAAAATRRPAPARSTTTSADARPRRADRRDERAAGVARGVDFPRAVEPARASDRDRGRAVQRAALRRDLHRRHRDVGGDLQGPALPLLRRQARPLRRGRPRGVRRGCARSPPPRATTRSARARRRSSTTSRAARRRGRRWCGAASARTPRSRRIVEDTRAAIVERVIARHWTGRRAGAAGAAGRGARLAGLRGGRHARLDRARRPRPGRPARAARARAGRRRRSEPDLSSLAAGAVHRTRGRARRRPTGATRGRCPCRPRRSAISLARHRSARPCAGACMAQPSTV